MYWAPDGGELAGTIPIPLHLHLSLLSSTLPFSSPPLFPVPLLLSFSLLFLPYLLSLTISHLCLSIPPLPLFLSLGATLPPGMSMSGTIVLFQIFRLGASVMVVDGGIEVQRFSL